MVCPEGICRNTICWMHDGTNLVWNPSQPLKFLGEWFLPPEWAGEDRASMRLFFLWVAGKDIGIQFDGDQGLLHLPEMKCLDTVQNWVQLIIRSLI
jgi:hypothetical protein